MKIYNKIEAWRKQPKMPMTITFLYHMATCATFAYTCGATPTKPQLASRLFLLCGLLDTLLWALTLSVSSGPLGWGRSALAASGPTLIFPPPQVLGHEASRTDRPKGVLEEAG